MTETVSDRIIDQRLRNRIMEVIEIIAMGEEGVLAVGFDEYFERFYDFVPYETGVYPNSTLSADEARHVESLWRLLNKACDDSDLLLVDEQFIQSVWPQRLQPVAQAALDLMLERGWHEEENEEDEPSRKYR